MFLKLIPLLKQLSETTDIVWVPQGNINQNLLRNVNDINVGFNNANMILYNRAIQEVLAALPDPPVKYWHSAFQISIEVNDGLDGLHFGPQTKEHLLQMLLNWMCQVITQKSSVLRDYRRLIFGGHSEEFCCD